MYWNLLVIGRLWRNHVVYTEGHLRVYWCTSSNDHRLSLEGNPTDITRPKLWFSFLIPEFMIQNNSIPPGGIDFTREQSTETFIRSTSIHQYLHLLLYHGLLMWVNLALILCSIIHFIRYQVQPHVIPKVTSTSVLRLIISQIRLPLLLLGCASSFPALIPLYDQIYTYCAQSQHDPGIQIT